MREEVPTGLWNVVTYLKREENRGERREDEKKIEEKRGEKR